MANTAKQLVILGSTGSIGRQTLQVVRALPGKFNVVGLAAGRNLELLSEQIEEFNPRFVYHEVTNTAPLSGGQCEYLKPEEMAILPDIDIVVIAISGNAGLASTLAAVRAGKNVALANKESLVMAGKIIMDEVERSGATIMPVDSEHSAIWQCLRGEQQEPSRIIITASGGPFRQYSTAQLEKVTAHQALQHPSWQMGKKVTIDSATLMNKGLEVIEAHWLFDMPFENIEVVIHPQSIIHSMVEFEDGSIKAQLSHPDMRLPIQYALTYPDRYYNPDLTRLDWHNIRELTFEQPDTETFPCLQMAIEAGKAGGTYPTVLCVADEIAVELFLSGKIGFTDIAGLVRQVIQQHEVIEHPSIDDIVSIDNWTRARVLELTGSKQ